MRQVLFLTILFVFGYKAHSQTHIGVEAGYTSSTARIVVNNIKQKSGYRNGFATAVLVDVPFEGKIHFTSSIGYQRTGYQAFYDSGSIKYTENNIHFISFSAGLSLNFPVGKKSTFIIGFAPVLSTPFSGKEKSIYRNDSVSNDKLIFAFGDYGVFDLGLKGNIGFKVKNILLDIGWFEGLTNLDTNEANLRNIRDRIFSFSIGYFFK